MLNLIIIGPPGSGKGTQAILVGKKYGLYHLVTGDLIREVKNQKSDLGQKIKKNYDQGDLIPDDIIYKIVRQTISKILPQKGIIFDLYPRTIAQMKGLSKICREFKLTLPWLVYLETDSKEVIKRLSLRDREDDREDVIVKRLAEYQRQTMPVIEYFRRRKHLIVVDGNPKIPAVFREIVLKLKELHQCH